MANRARTSLLLALLAVAACDPGTDPPRPGCLGRLTGAVTGAFTCDATAVYDPGLDTSTLGFDVLTLSGSAIDLLLDGTTFAGVPAAGVLTDQTPGIATYNNVVGGTEAAPVVYFTVRNNAPLPDLGTFSLTITSAEAATADTYVVHGTLSATMLPYPADAGAGTVTLEVSF